MMINPEVPSMSTHPRPLSVTHDGWTRTTRNAGEAIAGVLAPLGRPSAGRGGECANNASVTNSRAELVGVHGFTGVHEIRESAR